MRKSGNVETRRDRKALARHAGMGRISVLSVVAGALCAIAVFEILVTVAGAIAVAVNGGTDFSGLGNRQFKTVTGLILAVAMFLAFVVGGYVSGRMSRRSGATHGLLAGFVGVVLLALAGAVVIGTGADGGLAHVARHIQVADTWQQWRSFGLAAAVVLAAGIVLAGLAGGVEGERWHGKLLSRAVDPSYGPEAAERADARKSITDAEVARLAAAGRVGHVTGAEKAAAAAGGAPTVATPVVRPRVPSGDSPTVATPVVTSRATAEGAPTVAGERVPSEGVTASDSDRSADSDRAAGSDRTLVTAPPSTRYPVETQSEEPTASDTAPRSGERRHHLLGRR